MRSSRILLGLGLLLAGAFIVSLGHLFQLRYATGDVYPPYSSMRSDPRGTKALFQSLGRIRGLEVERNLAPLEGLAQAGPTTLLVLGLDARQLKQSEETLVKDWERVALGGGRLVISFAPENQKPLHGPALDQKDLESSPVKRTAKKGPKTPRADRQTQFVSLQARWGLASAYEELPEAEAGERPAVTVVRVAEAPVQEAIQWHTALCFTQLDPNWRVIYSRGQEAVLVERQLGSGTIVLSADSYFLSNQALREDCYPELLGWLVGSPRRVLFDETHLGIAERPGVASLARKYRLHGVFAGVVLLAGLFVWKSCYRLVPPLESQSRSGRMEAVDGRSSATGLVNLLRRSIAPAEVLFVCFDQWKASGALHSQRVGGEMEQMEAIMTQERTLAPKQRNPVETYRRLSRILADKKN